MQSNHWEKLTFSQSKDQQINEFIRKYQGSYLQMEYNGKKRIVRFSDSVTDEDNGDRTFYFSDVETNAVFEIQYDTDVVLTAIFPTTKFVNVGAGIRFFTRIPAKQYLRAPHEGNCTTIDPLQKLAYQNHMPMRDEFSLSAMVEAFNPKYTAWDVAVRDLSSNVVSGRALSPDFALTKHHESRTDMLLWYKMWPVASVSHGVINVRVPALKQEISDFIKRNRIGVQIAEEYL